MYKHFLTDKLSLQPKLGVQWYYLGSAILDRQSNSLSNPISGVSYQLGLELEALL